MKSIRDFLQGKIRRAEHEQSLRLTLDPPAADPGLGAFQGTLHGPGGQVDFYAEGMALADGTTLRYAEVAVVEPPDPADSGLEIRMEDGRALRLKSSAPGAEVVHATLRWIGHALLRKPLAR